MQRTARRALAVVALLAAIAAGVTSTLPAPPSASRPSVSLAAPALAEDFPDPDGGGG